MSSFNDYPTGRVIYTYAATSPFELSVSEGTSVTVLEDDDGSGWIKVDDGSGGKGLVPASYVNLSEEAPAPPSAKAKSSNGSGQFGMLQRAVPLALLTRVSVRGLYDYTAQGPDEMTIKVGQSIELSSGSSGGQNYASGWWEGINPSGQKKIFPSNYVSTTSPAGGRPLTLITGGACLSTIMDSTMQLYNMQRHGVTRDARRHAESALPTHVRTHVCAVCTHGRVLRRMCSWQGCVHARRPAEPNDGPEAA
jgi:hypothetical protein